MSKKTAELKAKIQEKGDEIKVLDTSLNALSIKRDADSITPEDITAFDADYLKRTALADELVELHAEMKREDNFAQVRRNSLNGSGGVQISSPSTVKDVKKHLSLTRMALLSDEKLRDEAKKMGHDHDYGFAEEMDQEFQGDVKRWGLDVRSGAIGVAGSVMRAMSVTGNSGNNGGVTVDSELDTDVIRLFRKANNLRDLGVRMKTNLKKDYEVIKEGSVLVAGWKGEIEEADLTDKAFATTSMSPKRLTAQTLYSRQLLIQSELSVDNELKTDLFGATDDVLMDTVINGNITAGIDGLLNSAITLIEAGPDANTGGALAYESIVAMFAKFGKDNASMEGANFLTNYNVTAKLMSTKIDAGSGRLVTEDFNRLMGRAVVNSNFVPDNISKGTSDANLNALVLAHFPDIDVSQWGGFTLITDPYTKAGTSQIRIVIDTFWDILIRRLKNHVAYKDVIASV
jgi:HK97 family phage major capsid protein